jgi:hypothetical protein
MPEEPKRDLRIVMMHLKDDQWYLARHPLHLTGDSKTFKGHDNAGVGPGLAFAEAMAAANPKATIGLVPCAVGGSSIKSPTDVQQWASVRPCGRAKTPMCSTAGCPASRKK